MATTYLGLSGVASDSLEGGGSGGESRSPERSSQGGRTKAHGSRHCGCRCTGRGTGRESTDRWTGGRKQKKVVGAGRGQRKERKGGAKFGRADGWWTPKIADVKWLGVQLDAALPMYRYGWEVLQRIKATGHMVARYGEQLRAWRRLAAQVQGSRLGLRYSTCRLRWQLTLGHDEHGRDYPNIAIASPGPPEPVISAMLLCVWAGSCRRCGVALYQHG